MKITLGHIIKVFRKEFVLDIQLMDFTVPLKSVGQYLNYCNKETTSCPKGCRLTVVMGSASKLRNIKKRIERRGVITLPGYNKQTHPLAAVE